MNQRFTECTELTVILHSCLFQIMVSNTVYALTVITMCVHNKTMTMWTSTKTECIERSFEKKNERNKNTLICELFKDNKNKRSCVVVQATTLLVSTMKLKCAGFTFSHFRLSVFSSTHSIFSSSICLLYSYFVFDWLTLRSLHCLI